MHGRENWIFAPPILNDTIRDLVANARKYSHPGTLISLMLGEKENRGLRLAVTDEGSGIPDSEMGKIIEFGFRGNQESFRKTRGYGLGVTKAYLLCRHFGGWFFIESAENAGTTIEMTLYPPG